MDRRSSQAGLGFGLSLPEVRVPVKRTKPVLSHEQVRYLYSIRWTVTQEAAAAMLNTRQSVVGRIWNRQAWRKVTEGMGGARDGWVERRRRHVSIAATNDGEAEHG
jgi:hypothetical protein